MNLVVLIKGKPLPEGTERKWGKDTYVKQSGNWIRKRYEAKVIRKRKMAYVKRELDFSNFHHASEGIWTPRVNPPSRAPDYVSSPGALALFNKTGERVGSWYWYVGDRVIRGSDHWGSGIKQSNWYIKGEPKDSVKLGKWRVASIRVADLRGLDWVKDNTELTKVFGSRKAWKDYEKFVQDNPDLFKLKQSRKI